MKNLLSVLVLLFALSSVYAQPYYLAGDFQGWSNNTTPMYDDGTNGDLVAGDGIYSREFSVATADYHAWKVTDGTWNTTWPAANSWFHSTSAPQTVLFTFNTNLQNDVWFPTQNIVNTNETKPTALVAVGDWQSEAGETGDWINNSIITAMSDDGQNGDWAANDGVFCYHVNTLPAGSWIGKAVVSGTWHSWGKDGRSEDGQNVDFATTTANQNVYFYVNTNTGRITIQLNTPIPVELVSFAAAVNNNSVELNWQTATETNNSGFDIERKVNSTWQSIGFVKGLGTSTGTINYSFVDENPVAGNLRYRLKQIDYNGEFTYSNTVDVNFITPIDFNLSQNYPNPFNPATSIDYALPVESNVAIEIYNTVGENLMTINNGVQATGTYKYTIDLSRLSSGIYFYKLSANSTSDGTNFTSIKKMVLLK
ncbi:MAG: T9SS type A sorting domain-containing protein [Ignavibacteriaceae bacterium]|nr:T9SS type A sorting domain-containing protein [Ignavibacteriaceae bacterium]